MSSAPAFDRHYDVIVVGARAAGAATAMLLARSGLKVLAIDRQAYGSDTLSTHALMRGGVAQLARWGVLPDLVRAGTPAIGRTTFYYGDEAIGIDIKADETVDALYAPRRSVLDRILVDAARASGADVRHGVALVGLTFAHDRRVTGASIRDTRGAIYNVSADLVIGADGRHSSVARFVGADTYRRSQHNTATIYGYFSGLGNRGFRWFYRPGIGAGAIPTNDGLTCIFVGMAPERFRQEIPAGTKAAFRKILRETSADFATEVSNATQLGPFRGFAGEVGYFRQSFGPGWALVGDAGYFKDPITAHGITDALRDAERLAQAVASPRAGAFRRYQEERDALSVELFEATEAIASFAWDLDVLKSHHQRLNKAMKAENAALAASGPRLPLAA